MSGSSAGAGSLVFDTDLLVWIPRGDEHAAAVVEETGQRWISAVTYMELVRGARGRRQLRELRAFVDDLALRVLPLTGAVATAR